MNSMEKVQQSLRRRYRFERAFKWSGITAIGLALAALMILLGDSIYKGHKAFYEHRIQLTISLTPELLGVESMEAEGSEFQADYMAAIRSALLAEFPEVSGFTEKRKLYALVSGGAQYQVQALLQETPELFSQTVSVWVSTDDVVDTYLKHFAGTDKEYGMINEQQQGWIKTLQQRGKLEAFFNTTFFTAGDSREPEQAGIRSALMGTFFTLVVTLLLSFPIGAAAAIYLEEFAPKNKWTDIIEVNVNNLAAVPSIIFGLLGLAVFINIFGTPRSAPVTGALVLTLMTLPTIIIAGRAAIKSVPPSIREAALGVGASKMQTVLHHVLPLSMPGMLTGAIIGMARALGETAPLLMIGMVAFIVDVPGSVTDPATVLPVQIYLWSDSPERAFTEKTSAAILVLLVFLVCMNALAIYLRRKLEKRW